MLRQQWLGHFGSLQLADIPQLSSRPPTAPDANPRAPAWDNAFGVRDVNLAVFARVNTNDHSRLCQWTRADAG